MEYISEEKVNEYIDEFKQSQDPYSLHELYMYLLALRSQYTSIICYEPTDREKNLLYCLSLRDDLTDKELFILSREYHDKGSIYNIIRNIAMKNNIDMLPPHPAIEEYRKSLKSVQHIEVYLSLDVKTQIKEIDEFQTKIEKALS